MAIVRVNGGIPNEPNSCSPPMVTANNTIMNAEDDPSKNMKSTEKKN